MILISGDNAHTMSVLNVRVFPVMFIALLRSVCCISIGVVNFSQVDHALPVHESPRPLTARTSILTLMLTSATVMKTRTKDRTIDRTMDRTIGRTIGRTIEIV